MAATTQLRLSETGRIEAFSDGVFAIAATLLVLDLPVPGSGHVVSAIREDWTGYAAYLAAFVTIAATWTNHHYLFSRVTRADPTLVILNLLLLLGVALLPWPTSLIAVALRHGHRSDQIAAIAVYAVVSLIPIISWMALSRSLSRRPDLLEAPTETTWMRRSMMHVSLTIIPVATAVALAFVTPIASLIIYLAVPLFFFVVSPFTSGSTADDDSPLET
jgi:uncharacterized membrane protein